VETGPGSIQFYLADGSRSKTFQLQDDGFQVRVASSQPLELNIPLLMLDALPGTPTRSSWFEFSPPGSWVERYQQTSSGDSLSWGWGFAQGARLNIQVNGTTLSASTFIDSREQLSQPENPDFGYPAGHFLPFPMAVVTFHAAESFAIDFTIK
jgi:hypothetical protein